jgi:hypothetical protein
VKILNEEPVFDYFKPLFEKLCPASMQNSFIYVVYKFLYRHLCTNIYTYNIIYYYISILRLSWIILIWEQLSGRIKCTHVSTRMLTEHTAETNLCLLCLLCLSKSARFFGIEGRMTSWVLALISSAVLVLKKTFGCKISTDR